ncbi:MAG: Unknown protein [uncultured Sulfurovum sp.]|uniref:Uncharacterized protein n=1 Tax=uncultured Sulfurovum sp. TaxID=269237 RepID=A0A6S6S6Y1_9BACT|nr:MAG: Unknown protein [uncultured Sulfurovum sp.]
MLYTTACTTTKPIQVASTKPIKLASNEPTPIGGGNPEVINDCFGLKKAEKEHCFNHFFPKHNLLIHPNHGKIIRLAGRGDSVERRDLNLTSDDELVLLYLDTTHVKLPLHSNVEASLFSYHKNTVVLNIDAKEIEDKIILTDNDGTIILEYTVNR